MVNSIKTGQPPWLINIKTEGLTKSLRPCPHLECTHRLFASDRMLTNRQPREYHRPWCPNRHCCPRHLRCRPRRHCCPRHLAHTCCPSSSLHCSERFHLRAGSSPDRLINWHRPFTSFLLHTEPLCAHAAEAPALRIAHAWRRRTPRLEDFITHCRRLGISNWKSRRPSLNTLCNTCLLYTSPSPRD